ncbi:PepSY domain-containing protein [Salegentibacter sp. LM13S]|uniref:PepSY domain-containing protein n=1 Tax=Salegentibacter lacus TaxID=2873599 RepID=UPI001CCF8F1E|nr:PepSY domain-containing protein [Salegentibacter lacus]MBZ9632144.1 PepSY domain-containing protein [Salegentibacter lacus]
MVKRKTARKLRQAHRYLGLFIGIQFIMWTISGMYFSWTDLDEIHGDHFKKEVVENPSFSNLQGPGAILSDIPVSSLELKDIGGEAFYLINGQSLVNPKTGEKRQEISREEALKIAKKHMREDLQVAGIKLINETGDHHEYRGGALPAYVISYKEPADLKAYISVQDAAFRSVRHRDWRWFDFRWMTHTMDYEGRDDFNNLVLRIFSLMGLITVLSGFVLWYISSPSIRKIQKRFK